VKKRLTPPTSHVFESAHFKTSAEERKNNLQSARIGQDYLRTSRGFLKPVLLKSNALKNVVLKNHALKNCGKLRFSKRKRKNA